MAFLNNAFTMGGSTCTNLRILYEKYDSYISTKLCKPKKSGTSSNYYTISTISLMVFVGCTEFWVIKTWPPNTNRTLKLHKYVGTFILSERTQKWLWFSRENPLITVLELVEETTRDSHEHILFLKGRPFLLECLLWKSISNILQYYFYCKENTLLLGFCPFYIKSDHFYKISLLNVYLGILFVDPMVIVDTFYVR